MAADLPTQKNTSSDRARFDPLGRAFVFSLAFHVLCYGGWRAEQRLHLLEKIHLPAFVAKVREKVLPPVVVALRPPEQTVKPATAIFLNVVPFNEAEPPKDTVFYSARSTRAANPEPGKNRDLPKINGTKTDILQTAAAEFANAVKLKPQQVAPKSGEAEQPIAPPPPSAPQEAKIKMPAGLTMQKRPEPDSQAEQPKPTRPRTLSEAHVLNQTESSFAGEKFKLSGGVVAIAQESSFDTFGNSFSRYEHTMAIAIRNHWLDLLQAQPLTFHGGEVDITFHLNSDGTISDAIVEKNTTTELLAAVCLRAIIAPSPYGQWPPGTLQLVGKNYILLGFKFTFQ